MIGSDWDIYKYASNQHHRWYNGAVGERGRTLVVTTVCLEPHGKQCSSLTCSTNASEYRSNTLYIRQKDLESILSEIEAKLQDLRKSAPEVTIKERIVEP